jgi:hypothetical protein
MIKLPELNIPFAKIIEEKYLYADKTECIYNLLTGYSPYLLTRPPRFGKSLFVSSLLAALQGRQELFAGLWIDSSDYAWPVKPTLYLNLEDIDVESAEELDPILATTVRFLAKSHDVHIQGKTAYELFQNLINAYYNKTKAKLSVIIEGYDAPSMLKVGLPEVAIELWNYLSRFYLSLDDPDKIELAFLIGEYTMQTAYVTNGLNFFDITMEPEYKTICGFTPAEFDRLFPQRLDSALKTMKETGAIGPRSRASDLRDLIFAWYGGYSWDGTTTVLNPYSTINFFKKLEFDNYWFKNARNLYPEFVNEATIDPIELLSMDVGINSSSNFVKSDYLSPELLLFHHGIMTVNRVVPSDPYTYHKLRFPNLEIKSSIVPSMLGLTPAKAPPLAVYAKSKDFFEAVLNTDTEAVESAFNDLVALMPPDTDKRYKYYKRVIFYALSLVDVALKTCEEPTTVFDYALEIGEGSYVVLKFKNVKKLSNQEKLLLYSFPKGRSQRAIRENFCPTVPERKINVIFWMILYDPDEPGIKVTVKRL